MRGRLLALLAIALLFTFASFGEVVKSRRKTTSFRRATAKDAFGRFHRFDPIAFKQQVEKARMERLRYTGIRVQSNTDLKTVNALQQQLITTMIERADFVPDERFERFRWIQEQQDTKITGWNAEIIDAMPGAGVLLVKLKVSPLHAGNAGLRTTDYTIETYAVSKAGVRHLETDAPASRGITTFN